MIGVGGGLLELRIRLGEGRPSVDAIHDLARKGLGAAWLPWSLVAGECRDGRLVALGGRSDEVHFDVRLYRPRARQAALVEAVWAAADR